MSAPDSQPTPQFGKAEYLGEPGSDRCSVCSVPLVHEYYRVNGVMTCPSCTSNAQSTLPKDTHSAYVRALVFGIGGAILGLILYSTFGIITGLMIGYLSLAVGYIIGRAMLMGSKGIGGRRYQVAAALLTYAAVSLSAIPISISMQIKEHKEEKQKLSDEQHQFEKEFGQQPSSSSPAQSAPAAEDAQQPKPGLASLLGSLALLGLASPFLELQDGFGGVIGLVILFVGIRIAWQMTAAKLPEITGPFQNSPAS